MWIGIDRTTGCLKYELTPTTQQSRTAQVRQFGHVIRMDFPSD